MAILKSLDSNEIIIKKFLYIDSIRGLAILGVIIFHVSIRIPNLNPFLHDIFNSGNYGVQLFFVASALTLFMSCHSRFPQERNPILSFSIRRIFRIAPLFWLAIIFYQFFHAAPGRIFLAENAKLWHVILTAFFIHGWHPASVNNIVPGGWSIAVEMTFYLLVPTFYKYIRNIKRSLIFAIITGLISILSGILLDKYFTQILLSMNYNSLQIHSFFYYLFPRQLPVFIFGFIAYYLINMNYQLMPSLKHSITFGKFILIIGLSISFIVVFFQKVIVLDFLIISFAFIFIIWGLSLYPFPLICNRYISYLGKISFSAYLSHFFVISLIVNNKLWETYITPHNSYISFLITLILVLMFTVIISSITYNLIEEQGQRLGKKIINSINNLK